MLPIQLAMAISLLVTTVKILLLRRGPGLWFEGNGFTYGSGRLQNDNLLRLEPISIVDHEEILPKPEKRPSIIFVYVGNQRKAGWICPRNPKKSCDCLGLTITGFKLDPGDVCFCSRTESLAGFNDPPLRCEPKDALNWNQGASSFAFQALFDEHGLLARVPILFKESSGGIPTSWSCGRTTLCDCVDDSGQYNLETEDCRCSKPRQRLIATVLSGQLRCQ